MKRWKQIPRWLQSVLMSAIIVPMCAGSVDAQHVYFGFGPGYSYGSGEIDGGRLALLFDVTYQKDRWQVSARYVECLDWHLDFGLSGGGSKVVDRTKELALLGGIRHQSEGNVSLSFEAGIGQVTGRTDRSILDSTGYPIGVVTFSSIGLALQSQFYYKRIGLTLFGNLNKRQSFVGASLCLRLGTYARNQ